MKLFEWLKILWKRVRYSLISLLQDKQETALPYERQETEKTEGTQISRQPGLNCPSCSFKILISIETLLSGAPVECASCGLKLNVEQEESRPVLDRLKKLDEVLKKADLSKK